MALATYAARNYVSYRVVAGSSAKARMQNASTTTTWVYVYIVSGCLASTATPHDTKKDYNLCDATTSRIVLAQQYRNYMHYALCIINININININIDHQKVSPKKERDARDVVE